MLDIKPNHPKRFGQHFLHDKIYIKRIIDALAIKDTDCFVEIGPGGGALTEHLLPLVSRLVAVEIDPVLCLRLSEKLRHWSTRFCLHQADALGITLSELVDTATQRVRFIGNLPYNIAMPLLFHWLKETRIKDFHIMVQKEVADRLVASPGTKDYSRLSVMIQYYCSVHPLFRVKSGAFYPAPKVESTMLRLLPRDDIMPKLSNDAFFSTVIKTAFNQRRKMVSNSLSSLGMTKTMLEACCIHPQARAESLTVSDYVRLTNNIIASRE